MTGEQVRGQLGLALVLENDPTRPARWVAAFVGISMAQVHAAIDAGDLPARHDGEQWQVPLWAVPQYFGNLVGDEVGRTANSRDRDGE